MHEYNGMKIYWHDDDTQHILIWDYPKEYKTDDIAIIGNHSDEMIDNSPAETVHVIMNMNKSDAERTQNMMGFFGSAFSRAESDMPKLGKIVFVAPSRFSQMFIEMLKKINTAADKLALFANSTDEAVAMLREADA